MVKLLPLFAPTLLAAGLLAFLMPALADAPTAAVSSTTASPARTPAPPVPLLWKVSDADNDVYLLGSFHLLKDADYPLSKDIDRAFEDAEKVVFEVPPAQLTDPATAQKFVAAAGYSDARQLGDVLPAATLARLEAVLAQGGASMSQLEDFEPWFVNLSLMLGVSQALGFSSDNGLDQHLMKRAAEAGKPTSGLETIDVQLRTLDASPMVEQVAALAEFIERPQEVPAMLNQLHQAWRDGDVAQLDRLARVQMREKTPETYRLVNVVRNDAWVPKIRRMLDDSRQDDTLVVVGALHLLGGDGVVEKLRAKGYAVERICGACSRPRAN